MTPPPIFHNFLAKNFPKALTVIKIDRKKFIEFFNEPLSQFVDPDPGSQLITDPDPS
jgi:hypothetical protein